MAVISTAITPSATRRTLASPVPSLVQDQTAIPSALIQFTQDGTAVTATGVGDTAALRISFELPVNFIYLLKDLYLTMSGTTTAAVWRAFRLEMFYGIDSANSVSTQIDMAMQRTFLADGASAALDRIQVAGFGGINDSSADSVSSYPKPASFPIFGRPGGDTTNPALVANCPTASAGPWVVSFVAEFFQFTEEQYRNVGMWYQRPTRNSS